MVSMFSTRTIREASKGKHKILDAGCGNGIQALYLARRNPDSVVYGYDILSESINKANEYKEKHQINNAHFYLSSHDTFDIPYSLGMIYTAESLIDESEFAHCYLQGIDPLISSLELIEKRLLKFSNSLSQNGIYLITLGSTPMHDEIFIKTAEKCNLRHSRTFKSDIPRELQEFFLPGVEKTALIFEKT